MTSFEAKKQAAPKVFISYSHDSHGHMDRVLELSDRLRDEGINCIIDQYEQAPVKGWPRWTNDQIEWADFVLIIFTEIYNKRFRAEEEVGKGLGAKWEGAIIIQELYDAEAINTKFIPLIFSNEEVKYIPTVLKGVPRYVLNNEDAYTKLYRRITNQPSILKPGIGKRRSLPLLGRTQAFTPALEQTESKKVSKDLSFSEDGRDHIDSEIQRKGSEESTARIKHLIIRLVAIPLILIGIRELLIELNIIWWDRLRFMPILIIIYAGAELFAFSFFSKKGKHSRANKNN